MLAIHAHALQRRFGDALAVDGLDLAVDRGEIYGFLGPNGAGKSTTVRMLVTLLAPTGGDAVILGRSIVEDPAAVRLSIGVALQDAALDAKQTGREILDLQARLYGLSRADARRRLAQLSALIDLGDALDRPVGTYSGGMRRRLDLAAALVHDPQVLFLDEPTTGLDPASRAAVWDEVHRLNAALGMTIFLTTQYLEEADRLADRVGIIAGGRLVAEGTPAALKRRIGEDLVVIDADQPLAGVAEELRALDGAVDVDVRGTEATVATTDGAALIGRIALALERGGVGVRQLQLRTPSLDDVFLQLTGARMAATDPTAAVAP